MKKSNQITKAILGFIIILFSFTEAYSQDVYEIKFTSNMTQYRAALILYKNGTGTMRVRYYANGSTKMVEQTIVFEKTTLGRRLTGYNPVYPGTTVKHPSYSADNFYVSTDENGKLTCVNIDDSGDASSCSIRLVSYYRNNFLKDFSWTID